MGILYLLDTSILVHLIRESPIGAHIREAYSLFVMEPKPLICVVSDGELRSLAIQWNWGERKLDQMRFFLGLFGRVSIDRLDLLKAYGTIDAHCKTNGIVMGKNDLWIAAAAYITDARLITTDTDFDHIDSVFIRRDWIDPEMFRPPQAS